MKIIKMLSLLAIVSSITFITCKKDSSDSSGLPTCTISGSLSYSTNMKGIIDEYCTGCHTPGGSGPGDYTSYEGIKADLASGKVGTTTVVNKTMPQGTTMPQAKIDSINCWIQAGYPK